MPIMQAAAPADGAIFHASMGYAPLTSGARAAMVGDLVTVVLVESTQAQKSNSADTSRTSNIGLTPPTTGPLSFFTSTDASMGGSGTFKGKGDAAQSNALNGAITVTIAQVLPNNIYLIRGEKHLTLNSGDEVIQISGLIRAADIDSQNNVLSTRVANAQINYTGKGEIARASTQGWLGRFFSRVSPF
jgi:flagellar L-ring protein FlgH